MKRVHLLDQLVEYVHKKKSLSAWKCWFYEHSIKLQFQLHINETMQWMSMTSKPKEWNISHCSKAHKRIQEPKINAIDEVNIYAWIKSNNLDFWSFKIISIKDGTNHFNQSLYSNQHSCHDNFQKRSCLKFKFLWNQFLVGSYGEIIENLNYIKDVYFQDIAAENFTFTNIEFHA